MNVRSEPWGAVLINSISMLRRTASLRGRQSSFFRWFVCSVLLVCLVIFILGTLNWHLVNDAAQIDYVCFLMDHGLSPYKDIVEMNMPGIYLINGAVMHTLGAGPLAWRFFDLVVLLVSVIAMVAIAYPYDWLAGLYGGILFALFHGRDGPAQTGQRDLIISMLLLLATAFVFEAIRRNTSSLFFFGGFFAAAALTVKPPALFFCCVLLASSLFRFKQLHRAVRPAVLWSVTGFALPLALVFAFLRHYAAMAAFFYVVRFMLPFYARLGRQNLSNLFFHSLTPSLLTLIVFGLVIALFDKASRNWETLLLAVGALLGGLSYLAQGRGFPYHRYPMIAFGLLWASILFFQALRGRGAIRYVACCGVIFGVVVAPLYAVKAIRSGWDEAYNTSLQTDLDVLGGSSLSGHVLCLATAGDCDTILLRMKLVQSSGLIYDFFVFGDGGNPVVARSRNRILPVLLDAPPAVIIVSRGLYPSKTDAYEKLGTWPAFDAFLSAHYFLYAERGFAPAESGLRGYRLYRLRPSLLKPQNDSASASKITANVAQ